MAGLAVLRIFKKTMPALLTIICCSVSLMLLSHGILYAGLLLAVLSLAIVMLMLLGSPRTFPVRDACIGLLLTGALLIKINVGILCCLAVASVVTFQALSPGSNKAVRVLGYALSILLAIAISFITVLQSRTFIGWSLIELAAAGALLLTLAHQIRNHATAHAHNIASSIRDSTSIAS